MKRRLLILAILIALTTTSCFSQKYITKTGKANFLSHTDAIDIDGTNQQVGAVVNTETGDIVVIVLVNAFEFTLATADKHFKETYMETELFPKAIYKGKITNIKEINLSKTDDYLALTEGSLTIHGKTNQIKTQGTISVKENSLLLTCKFDVSISDYGIEVPSTVKDRVAEKVDIKISLPLSEKK